MADSSVVGGEDRNPMQYVNIVGAAVSSALLIMIVVWGGKTLTRDASGVPMVW